MAFLCIFETNLLTRCHSASSYFLLFLYFKKVTREIFSELDKTKAKVYIYLTRRWSPKERWRGARRQSHHRVAWAFFIEKTLKDETLLHKTYCKPPPSSSQDREGPEALPGTLPERGIITGGLLHHHASL
jgi:hypothetical protein